MFTYRFFEVPIRICDRDTEDKNEELGIKGDRPTINAIAKILPLQIESYRESIERDADFTPENLKTVSVYMKSGDSYVVYWTLKEFEKKLNEFEENIVCR